MGKHRQKLVCKELGYDESGEIFSKIKVYQAPSCMITHTASTSRFIYTSQAPHVTIGNCSMDAKSLQECEVREITDCTMQEQLICNRGKYALLYFV